MHARPLCSAGLHRLSLSSQLPQCLLSWSCLPCHCRSLLQLPGSRGLASHRVAGLAVATPATPTAGRVHCCPGMDLPGWAARGCASCGGRARRLRRLTAPPAPLDYSPEEGIARWNTQQLRAVNCRRNKRDCATAWAGQQRRRGGMLACCGTSPQPPANRCQPKPLQRNSTTAGALPRTSLAGGRRTAAHAGRQRAAHAPRNFGERCRAMLARMPARKPFGRVFGRIYGGRRQGEGACCRIAQALRGAALPPWQFRCSASCGHGQVAAALVYGVCQGVLGALQLCCCRGVRPCAELLAGLLLRATPQAARSASPAHAPAGSTQHSSPPVQPAHARLPAPHFLPDHHGPCFPHCRTGAPNALRVTVPAACAGDPFRRTESNPVCCVLGAPSHGGGRAARNSQPVALILRSLMPPGCRV